MFMQRRSQFDKAKSGRISFLDVLSAVPFFSEGLFAVYDLLSHSSLKTDLRFARPKILGSTKGET
jgi:hypothetical protein